jgi:hypothetical protein
MVKMLDGSDGRWRACFASSPGLVQGGRWDRGAGVGLPRTEPHIVDCGACDKRHSTALARERWGFPIWSAFKHDIRAFRDVAAVATRKRSVALASLWMMWNRVRLRKALPG